MSTASQMYAASIDQVFNAIRFGGAKRTVLVQGHMGTGKSSLLAMLAEALPGHEPFYFDCTTKDLGDITIPDVKDVDGGASFVRYVTNEELGFHLDKPIILMIDEYGKANPAVKNALMRPMLERKMGNRSLHPDSIVFATTNLGSEGVGDLLQAHTRNRITVTTMAKPSAVQWIEWGIEHGIDHTMLGWVRDNQHVFQSFEDVSDPDENPYIYHPRSERTAFVTPRSLEAASDWMKLRDKLDRHTLTAQLVGTVGDRAAMDLMAFVDLADDLPTLESIKKNPAEAKVPSSPSAVCMVVYRALATIDRNWVDAWLTYCKRLSREAQGLFVNGIRSDKYNANRRDIIMNHPLFGQWLRDNQFLFTEDKGV